MSKRAHHSALALVECTNPAHVICLRLRVKVTLVLDCDVHYAATTHGATRAYSRSIFRTAIMQSLRLGTLAATSSLVPAAFLPLAHIDYVIE